MSRSRKNPRTVRAILSLPIDSCRELMLHQSYCRKSLSDDIKNLHEMVNTNREVSDSDCNLILNKISSLRDYVNKCFTLIFVILLLGDLILILS